MSTPVDRRRRTLVLALALAGCASTATAGGAPATLGGLAAVGLLLSRVRRAPPGARELAAWRVANVLVLLLAVGAGLAGLPILTLGVGFVSWLLVHRALTGTRAADDRVTLLLSLLLLLLSCILSISLALVPVFLAFAFLSPAALASVQVAVEREAGLARLGSREPAPPILLLGVVSLLLSALLFVLTPRTDRPGGLLGVERTLQVAGYGGEVVVGEGGGIADNPEVVLRVRMDGDAGVGPWYLRGEALDHFDGARWTRTRGPLVRFPSRAPPPGALRQEILQEPLPETVLFGVPEVVALSGLDEVVALDAGDGLRLRGAPRSLRYTVWSVPAEPDPARLSAATPDPRLSARSREAAAMDEAGVWTQLPADLDPAIGELAARVLAESAAGPGAWDQARALERYLREQFRYTDDPDAQLSSQSLSEFLLVNRQGHCEYFATALAVMLRSQGLPARVVTGFLGGEWNDLGDYLVFRQRDAHAWVELNLGREGWVRLDGTPISDELPTRQNTAVEALDWAQSRWKRLILDYDLSDQMGFVLSLGGDGGGGDLHLPTGGGLLLLGALVGLVLGGRLMLSALAGERGGRGAARGPLATIHARARRQVARKGWEIPSALPPVAAAEWLLSQAGEAGRPLLELAWLLYRARYGGEGEEGLVEAGRAQAEALAGLPERRG